VWQQEIEAPMVGFVTTAVPWHPDIVIRVDGHPVPVERVNYAFAGVEVGRGRHEIVITFASRAVSYGAIITTLSMIIWCLFAVTTWRSAENDLFSRVPRRRE
jgi:uncharacterized membrane protein YfhO